MGNLTGLSRAESYLVYLEMKKSGFEVKKQRDAYGVYKNENYLGLLDCYGRFDVSSVAQEEHLEKLIPILEQHEVPISRLCQMSSEPELGLDLNG